MMMTSSVAATAAIHESSASLPYSRSSFCSERCLFGNITSMDNRRLDPQAAQRTLTFIGLSLAFGVTAFALVAWLMQRSGDTPRTVDLEFNRVLVYAWLALTAVTSFASLFFWRTRVEPMIGGIDRLPFARMSELTANVLICWALVEAAALFGVTVYFLTGTLWPGLVGVLLIWSTVLQTRPQIEWFERFRD